MEDSIRASCSSPFRSSTGLSLKRRTTCQINEEDGQPDLFKDTATLQDRAARKEIERVRLRKLLNQGKKKRRRLNSDKLVASPRNGPNLGPVDDFPSGGTTSFNHCHRKEPHVPRKSRSVGYRRKGKSWRAIAFRLFNDQIELPIPSAPTKVEKSSPFSVQNEIEIEFEIAEVLSGLKKQVSSSDELLIDDLEKTPMEDVAKINLEGSTGDSGNLTSSKVSAAELDSTESKQPVKFVIDLNEPPPLEGDGMEQLTEDSKDDENALSEEERIRRFVLPWKMEIKGELHDLDLGSSDGNKNERKQTFQKQQNGYSYTSIETDLLGHSTNPPQGISFCRNLNSIQYGKQGFEFYSHNIKQENNLRRASNNKIKDEHVYHQSHNPFQAGHLTAGPLIFPLNQSQTVMGNHDVQASSIRNVRITRAPFLSVLPGNVCNNPLSDSKRVDSSEGKKADQFPFLDRQLHPSQMCLPIQIQQQKYLPFTAQAISSVADNRTFTGQTNVFQQSRFPLHSRNVVLMPSASSGGGGQWKYARKHVLKSEHTQCQSSDEAAAAAGQALNFSMPYNHVAVPSFLDKANFGSQILPADHGLQHRHSEMMNQRINQADSTLVAENSPSRIKQSGFVLKSCSAISTAPNCKLSFSKQNAISAVQLKNQQQLQAMAASQLKRLSTVNNQHQQPTAANVSTDFYDRSSTLHIPQQKLTIPNSHLQI
ncbi:hypothetical protein V2J09_016272 [Rumex salicifolius]